MGLVSVWLDVMQTYLCDLGSNFHGPSSLKALLVH